MSFEWLGALWLLPAALAVLVLLRFLRARRTELRAGSLLLWKRVAAKAAAPQRKHFEVDRSLILQALALTALALALAGPVLKLAAPPGRRLVLILDNGPAARARRPDGRLVWESVLQAARERLAELEQRDRVWLAVTTPFPRETAAVELPPAEAMAALEQLAPGITHVPAEDAWTLLLEHLRKVEGASATAAVAGMVCSPRAAPPPALHASGRTRWLTAGPGPQLDNVALTAFGAEELVAASPQARAAEILVQVRNFGLRQATGQVTLETLDLAQPLEGAESRSQAFALQPGETAAAVFRIAQEKRPPLRVVWQPAHAPDAWPEDDAVAALPRLARKPLVRLHGAAPHLQELWTLTGEAEFLAASSSVAADLEVYADTMPAGALPDAARAVLLLAPPQNFGPFEVSGKLLERPMARLGEPDALTRGLSDAPEGLGWPVFRARELLQLGDWRPLLRTNDGKTLAARFRIRGGRPGYVLGFVPGDGLPRERKLEPPELPLLLIRLVREAAGASAPYAVEQARAVEHRTGAVLPLNWKPTVGGERGVGVLDARASDLNASLGHPAATTPELSTLLPTGRSTRLECWHFLLLAAAACMVAEWRLARHAPQNISMHKSASMTAEAPRSNALQGLNLKR